MPQTSCERKKNKTHQASQQIGTRQESGGDDDERREKDASRSEFMAVDIWISAGYCRRPCHELEWPSWSVPPLATSAKHFASVTESILRCYLRADTMSTPYYTAGQPSTSQSTQPATSQPQSSQQPSMSYAYPLVAGQQPYAPQAQPSQPTASTSTGGSGLSADPKAQSSRLAAEEARKDRTLAEFLLMLDDYDPLVSFPFLIMAVW